MRRTATFTAWVWLLSSCAGLPLAPTAQSEFERGLALFQAGRFEEAIPNFVHSTELDPGFAKPYVYLGRSYLNLGRWAEALAPLRSAHRLAPQDLRAEATDLLLDALFSLAVRELGKGNFSESIGHLREGLALQPEADRFRHELAGVWFLFGRSLLSRGQVTDAVDAFIRGESWAKVD